MTKTLVNILLTIILLFILLFIATKGYDTYLYIEDKLHKYLSNTINIPKEVSKYKKAYEYKKFKNTENFTPNNKEELYNIYYTVLNNGWDTFTFYCPLEYTECYKDVNEIANNQKLLTLMNNFVSPYNTYVHYNTVISNENEIYLNIIKLYNENDIDNINDKIDAIFNELNITTGNKENIKKLHDYLILNNKYDSYYVEGDYYSNSYKATGALLYGKSVCSGYTDSLAIMLDRLNVPNFKIATDNHIWNALYLDNKWLHIDATWNDDEHNPNNRHNFFLIDTNRLLQLDSKEHNFNKNEYIDLN